MKKLFEKYFLMLFIFLCQTGNTYAMELPFHRAHDQRMAVTGDGSVIEAFDGASFSQKIGTKKYTAKHNWYAISPYADTIAWAEVYKNARSIEMVRVYKIIWDGETGAYSEADPIQIADEKIDLVRLNGSEIDGLLGFTNFGKLHFKTGEHEYEVTGQKFIPCGRGALDAIVKNGSYAVPPSSHIPEAPKGKEVKKSSASSQICFSYYWVICGVPVIMLVGAGLAFMYKKRQCICQKMEEKKPENIPTQEKSGTSKKTGLAKHSLLYSKLKQAYFSQFSKKPFRSCSPSLD